LVFAGSGEFHDFAAAIYHSAENYTTLGYGDVVMSASWRLLGPLEAADGMLMFGVSTALIFTLINRLVGGATSPLGKLRLFLLRDHAAIDRHRSARNERRRVR